jgi:hypothetical protein
MRFAAPSVLSRNVVNPRCHMVLIFEEAPPALDWAVCGYESGNIAARIFWTDQNQQRGESRIRKPRSSPGQSGHLTPSYAIALPRRVA